MGIPCSRRQQRTSSRKEGLELQYRPERICTGAVRVVRRRVQKDVSGAFDNQMLLLTVAPCEVDSVTTDPQSFSFSTENLQRS